MLTKTLHGCKTTIKPFTWPDRAGRPHNQKSYEVTVVSADNMVKTTRRVRGPAAAIEVRGFYSFMLR